MPDKAWRHAFQTNHEPRTFRFGLRLEAYRWVTGWPSITLTVYCWHKAYRFWLYKTGED